MGLRNIVIRRETIVLNDGQSFEVRGISLFDIMSVLNDYGPKMALVFGKVVEQRLQGEGLFDNAGVRKIITDLSGEFPDVLAAAIALASDDYTPESVKVAKQLTLLKQLEAVEKIVGLTFESEGDVKKLVESLTQMVVAATGTLGMATNSLSPTGIGDSVVN